MKWLAVFALIALQCSCTTLANRRDLYSPQPASDSMEISKRRTTTTKTTTIKTEAAPEEGAPAPPPFR